MEAIGYLIASIIIFFIARVFALIPVINIIFVIASLYSIWRFGSVLFIGENLSPAQLEEAIGMVTVNVITLLGILPAVFIPENRKNLKALKLLALSPLITLILNLIKPIKLKLIISNLKLIFLMLRYTHKKQTIYDKEGKIYSLQVEIEEETKQNFSTGENEEDDFSKLCPYEVLEVSKSATEDELKKAYRKKMKEYHLYLVTNLGSKLKDLAENKVKKINLAYDRLK